MLNYQKQQPKKIHSSVHMPSVVPARQVNKELALLAFVCVCVCVCVCAD